MKKAFTLIELLVVIAIIALLLSIIVPAMRMAKMKASSAVCLVNTKNMSLAWYGYQEDNDGRIMSSGMEMTEVANGPVVGWIGRPHNTVINDRSDTAVTPIVTDEDEIRGIKRGRLYEYLDTPDVYHCPGDKLRKSKYDGTAVFVSYVVPRCLYGYATGHSLYNNQIRKFNEITAPAMRYLFVESGEERNWNQSGWFSFGSPEWTKNGTWAWWGPMAINHGDSSTLGFVDGHAELRKWRDPFTRERVTKLSRLDVAMYNIEYPPPDQVEDLEYMARGWAYRYKK